MRKGVVETVFFDWGLSFAVGLAFAAAGGAELRAAPSKLRSRAFRVALGYEIGGFASISLALYALNRDWMWMSWIDPRGLPMAIEILAFALYPVVFAAGFLLGAEMRPTSAWRSSVATSALVLAGVIAARGRVLHFGDIQTFTAGTAEPAGELPVEILVLALAGTASIAALANLLIGLRRRAG